MLAMALWAYTMYGAGITPALLAALVWPRATKEAGIYSIAAGMSVTLLWELAAVARGTIAAPEYIFGLQTIYPALLASVGTLVGITVAGNGKRKTRYVLQVLRVLRAETCSVPCATCERAACHVLVPRATARARDVAPASLRQALERNVPMRLACLPPNRKISVAGSLLMRCGPKSLPFVQTNR